jgi:cyclomaltodextrinase / maltogenic alpha-amylase / neopullulanase
MQTITPGKYKHYKGGEYEVVGIARDEETLDKLIVYKALYETKDFPKGSLWVRPLEMFMEEVDVEGELVPRFSMISDV